VAEQETQDSSEYGRVVVPAEATACGARIVVSPSPQEKEATSLSYMADLRATTTQRGHDPAAAPLVSDLCEPGAEFAEMWDQHRVSPLRCSAKTVFNQHIGRLDLDCVVLASPLSRQRLLLRQPVPGTETTDGLSRLQLLINGGVKKS